MKGAMVTGVGPNNIGFGVAKRLAAAGASLVVADYRAIGAEITAQLRAAGAPHVHALKFDVSNETSVVGAIAAAFAALPELDALAHCSGISQPTEPLSISTEMWDRMMGVNLRGTFLTCQAFIRELKARNRKGSLVNVASMAAFTGGHHNGVHYAASKAGVVALSKGLARHFGKDGIRVNAIAPGIISTALATDFDFFVKQGEASPIGRLGTIEEVGDSVVFLLSENSSYITGTTVQITGGI